MMHNGRLAYSCMASRTEPSEPPYCTAHAEPYGAKVREGKRAAHAQRTLHMSHINVCHTIAPGVSGTCSPTLSSTKLPNDSLPSSSPIEGDARRFRGSGSCIAAPLRKALHAPRCCATSAHRSAATNRTRRASSTSKCALHVTGKQWPVSWRNWACLNHGDSRKLVRFE